MIENVQRLVASCRLAGFRYHAWPAPKIAVADPPEAVAPPPALATVPEPEPVVLPKAPEPVISGAAMAANATMAEEQVGPVPPPAPPPWPGVQRMGIRRARGTPPVILPPPDQIEREASPTSSTATGETGRRYALLDELHLAGKRSAPSERRLGGPVPFRDRRDRRDN